MNNALPLVIANLKANKTWDEVSSWIDDVAQAAQSFRGTIVFCPSHPFLAAAYVKISQNGINLKLGTQDISQFEQGAYTGGVAASQIADLVKFAIIGHSERRQNFKEDYEILERKAKNALSSRIEPIFCVQTPKDQIPQDVKIVAYEPVFAIGTGNPDTAVNIQKVAREIKAKRDLQIVYGGSVNSTNVNSFIVKDLVDGVLVGATNSFDPGKFIAILKSLSP